REAFNAVARAGGLGEVTTELRPAADAGPFYYAEPYHQQYLYKNPGGYCNHGPNGCQMPALTDEQLAVFAAPRVNSIELD
ncbi:MAG: peptide-methionine (S)-S-oxide reductase, partial [Beutenbergiaceae bacterium]